MDYYYEQYFNTNEGKKTSMLVFNLQLDALLQDY